MKKPNKGGDGVRNHTERGVMACLAAIAIAFVPIAHAMGQAQGQQQGQTAQQTTAAQQTTPAQQQSQAQAPAQKPATQPPAVQGPPIKVNANLVTVFATVKDKHGKIVANLTKDQFALTEDGRVPRDTAVWLSVHD